MELFVQNIYECKNIENIVKTLPNDRYEKYLAYKKEADKLACVVGYDLIRQNIGSGDILKNEFGKPYINDAPHFNLSHSGDYVILAKNSTAIGCDIEKVVDIDVKKMSEYAFHKKEIEYLKIKNYDLKTFYKIWTIKESYLKMLGKGLSKDLNSFFVDLETFTINECDELSISLNEGYDNYVIAVVY